MKITISAVLGTVSLLALAAPAAAQTLPAQPGPVTQPGASTPAEGSTDQAALPDADALGDIVVTAQRRQERVTDVPISITVANQAQLERQQVNTVNDLARIAPSLEIQGAPGQNTGGGGAIRGIGTQTFSAGAVASVGVVVDQVSQGNANIGDLFDVARIEVLKGPQGTLFGLTTSAGVINITTNAPDPSAISGRVRTELSSDGFAGSEYGNQIVQGVLNLPLAANAAVRVSGLANLRQGPGHNTLGGGDNESNRYGGRARLLWTPADAITVNLIGDYTKSTYNGASDFLTFVRTGGPGPFFGGSGFDPVGITARLAGCGVTPREGNTDFCTAQSLKGRSETFGTSLEVDYDAGPVTLTSISAYRGSRERGAGVATNVFRADPLELDVQNGYVHRNLNLFTQELRLSSPSNQTLEYTVGAFFSHQKQTRDPESVTVTLRPAPGVAIPILTSLGADDTIIDKSVAVFGQGTLHVGPALRLIAGARYTRARLSLDRINLDMPANPNSSTGLKSNKLSYRFGAQYDLMARTMVYATLSRGFKGGQIATPNLPAVPFVVRPEVPTAYEAGFKSTLFGGWVADINVFYQKIRDFQAQQCTIVPNSGNISCVQTNISGVKSRGAEINFFGRVFEGLSLNTGFIFAKATYPGGFIGTDSANIGGTQLAYAPKYKFTLSGEYEQHVTDDVKAFFAADTVWKSRLRYEANARPETTFRPHWMVGGRIGVRSDDDRYSLALFGRNLFNVHEPLLLQSDFPYNGADNVGAIYGPQSFRQVGLSLDAKF